MLGQFIMQKNQTKVIIYYSNDKLGTLDVCPQGCLVKVVK